MVRGRATNRACSTLWSSTLFPEHEDFLLLQALLEVGDERGIGFLRVRALQRKQLHRHAAVRETVTHPERLLAGHVFVLRAVDEEGGRGGDSAQKQTALPSAGSAVNQFRSRAYGFGPTGWVAGSA